MSAIMIGGWLFAFWLGIVVISVTLGYFLISRQGYNVANDLEERFRRLRQQRG